MGLTWQPRCLQWWLGVLGMLYKPWGDLTKPPRLRSVASLLTNNGGIAEMPQLADSNSEPFGSHKASFETRWMPTNKPFRHSRRSMSLRVWPVCGIRLGGCMKRLEIG